MPRLCMLMLLGLLVAAALPAAASAAATPPTPQVCAGSSDVAALDEYCPTLPSADGRGKARGPRLSSVLPAAAVRRLERSGMLGQVLLALPLSTPKSSLGGKSRGRGLDAEGLLRRGMLGGGDKHRSGNPIEVAATTLTSGGKMGVAFGSLLLVSAFGMATEGWSRFRRRRSRP